MHVQYFMSHCLYRMVLKHCSASVLFKRGDKICNLLAAIAALYRTMSVGRSVGRSVCRWQRVFKGQKNNVKCVIAYSTNEYYAYYALWILCIMHIMHYAYYALCILCIMHIMQTASKEGTRWSLKKDAASWLQQYLRHRSQPSGRQRLSARTWGS